MSIQSKTIHFGQTSRLVLRAALHALMFAVGSVTCQATDEPNFYRDVRPILAKACFHCHGPDEETREANLRLDRPEGLFGTIDDRTVVARGDADHSELVQRILSTDPDQQMPPADSGKQLTTAQKEILIQWINAGASWQEHWAFVAPQLPAVPEPAAPAEIHSRWSASEIDRFVLQKQSAAGLSPSPRAEPEIQVRRIFLDLLGLPPTIEEAELWTSRLQEDQAKGSDENSRWKALIDHLLNRPEYGERWARAWLDLARYADTNGYEKDRPRSIWPYRDWVINALNVDMPFDQFTVEQLAGDLLPNSTASQRIATGFHRNTMLNEEGGIDPLEFRFHAMTDRVATTGTTWLGLTVGCGQCHTHKYDPVTHHDYYSMMAFLNNADEPSLTLPDNSLNQRRQANELEAAKRLEALPSQWPVNTFAEMPVTVTNVASDGGETFSIQNDQSVYVGGPVPEAKTAYIVDAQLAVDSTTAEVSVAALQLKAFKGPGTSGPGRAENGNFVLCEIQVSLLSESTAADGSVAETEIPIPLKGVAASVEQAGYSAASSIDGDPNSGWAIDSGKGIPESAEATFEFDPASLQAALKQTDGATKSRTFRIRLVHTHGAGHFLGAFRISLGKTLSAEEVGPQRTELVQQRFQEWLKEQRATAAQWTPLHPTAVSSNMPHLTVLADDSVLATGDTTKQDRYEIELAASAEPITAIRLEALPDERLPGNGPGTTYYEGSPGDFYLNEFSVFAHDQKANIASATESYTRNQFGNTPTSAALTLDGDVQTGWSVAGAEGRRHTAVYVFDKPFPQNTPMKIQMTFGRHFASSLGRFRISATSSESNPIAKRISDSDESLLTGDESKLTSEEQKQLFHTFLLNASELAGPADEIRHLLNTTGGQTTLVLQERPADNPRPTYRHHRGEYLQAKEPVSAASPESLHPWPEDLPRNRLGFAQWLVHRTNPLTARVLVNRTWAAFFGRGIVSTVDDFGIQGTAPTHPELLDWLAVTVMDVDHWSLKALHRRIVMSETYRQSGVVASDSAKVDPGNELLSYAPRFRLDAEIVRDSIVQAAGVLSKKQGGPPVRPLQPRGITEVAFGSPGWDVSIGEDRYRRSIYTFIKRTAPFAMVTTFDGPSGEACIARRSRSNTPLQALTLLNDPMFVDLAQQSGRNLVSLNLSNDQERVEYLFRQLLTRAPDDEELSTLLGFVTHQREHFTSNPELAAKVAGTQLVDAQPGGTAITAAEQATWVALSRAVFSLDEVVMRP